MTEGKVRPFEALIHSLNDFETRNPGALDLSLALHLRYRTLTRSQKHLTIYGPVWGYGTRLVSNTDTAERLRTKLTVSANGMKHDLHPRQGEIIEAALLKLHTLSIGAQPKLYEYVREKGTPISEG